MFGVKVAAGVVAALLVIIIILGFVGSNVGDVKSQRVTCTGYVVNEWVFSPKFSEVQCVQSAASFCFPLAWKSLAWFEDEGTIKLVAGDEVTEKSITVSEGNSKDFTISVCGTGLSNPKLSLLDSTREVSDTYG